MPQQYRIHVMLAKGQEVGPTTSEEQADADLEAIRAAIREGTHVEGVEWLAARAGTIEMATKQPSAY